MGDLVSITRFADVRKVGFDLETTGVDVETARIVTASIVAIGGGKEELTFNYLVNPGIEIPKEASAIHGVSTEIARASGLNASEALDEIAEKLSKALDSGMPVVAYNLSYDWTVLDRELRRNNLPVMAERVNDPIRSLIDPYVIDKYVHRYRKGSRKLQHTAHHYDVHEISDWHSSDADARAAVLIAEKLFQRYPYLDSMGPGFLYQYQQRWKREQAESLEAYFRNESKSGEKFNPDAVVDRNWPLVPVPGQPEIETDDWMVEKSA